MPMNYKCGHLKDADHKPSCTNCARIRREIAIATRLVDDALTQGYEVSVFDCEAWTVNRSTDRKVILSAMATTDDDRLAFWKGGIRNGTAWLLYSNDRDLISDWSWNASAGVDAQIMESRMDALLQPVLAYSETLP